MFVLVACDETLRMHTPAILGIHSPLAEGKPSCEVLSTQFIRYTCTLPGYCSYPRVNLDNVEVLQYHGTLL